MEATEDEQLPRRRIPLGRRSLTGRMPVKGSMVHHESALEGDLLVLLDANPTVRHVLEQPVRIPYRNARGRRRTYVPDFRATFCDGSRTFFEVKYRDDLRAEWGALRPRLRAGVAHARAVGARFKILTEVEIRGPLLANLRFLRRFRPTTKPDDPTEEHLVASLEALGTATPASLLAQAYASEAHRLTAIPAIWRLVAGGRIGTRLSLPLTMASQIWVMDGHGAEWPGPHSLDNPLASAFLRRGTVLLGTSPDARGIAGAHP